MRRREFTLAASTLGGSAILTACGGGTGTLQGSLTPTATGWAVTGAGAAVVPVAATGTAPAAAAAPVAAVNAPVAVAGATAMGTNLSGMEWASPGLRFGVSTAPNLNFTVPRATDVAYLASTGFTKNRLPIQWELLQPVLSTSSPNASVAAILGAPGAFHPAYQAFITSVLDAHAAAGTKCIIDCHNYCRYQDFVYESNGSIVGLTVHANPNIRPYTTDNTKVIRKIMALAGGATVSQAAFNDFWTRAALKWQAHAGFGGYGLMNEPHDMPVAGGVTGVFDAPPYAGNEDLTIWPKFAQGAIDAIRAVDPTNPIYVSGNGWDSAMSVASSNPGFPLRGSNLIYEVHMYLDAFSNGYAFDYDTEVAKNYSAGIGAGSITSSTGADRLKLAVDWAKTNNVKIALTEVGMPIDDPRWESMFKQATAYALQSNCEVYSWMGGSHWATRNYAINHVTGWHQNKTLAASVSGAMQSCAGTAQATVFDDGPGVVSGGTAVTITVYVRGNLAAPLTLAISSNNGGTLSSPEVTIPAGSNGQATYTYTPASNRVATLTYSGAAQVPPPRKVFSLSDPVAYAATSLPDAAKAIIAKYSACKWEMADGYTDYQLGRPAADGDVVRAVSDSGYGSSPGNAMEMINFSNTESSTMGTMSAPVMRVTNGKKNSDHSAYDTFGFWCKKSAPMAGVQANPKNRVPYNAQDAHFAIAAISVAGVGNSGVVFQASKAEEVYTSELCLSNSQPQARWVDANGQNVQLISPTRLTANTPAVVAFTSAPGAQQLRVNSALVASSAATLAPGTYAQMLIGWGFLSYYPRDGFQGKVYSVITGKGAPTAAEMGVLERYLATTTV